MPAALFGLLALTAAGTFYMSDPIRPASVDRPMRVDTQLTPGAVAVSRASISDRSLQFDAPRPTAALMTRPETPSAPTFVAFESAGAPIQPLIAAPRPEVSFQVSRPLPASAPQGHAIIAPLPDTAISFPAPQLISASVQRDKAPFIDPAPRRPPAMPDTVTVRRPPSAEQRPDRQLAATAHASLDAARIVIHHPSGQARKQARDLVAKLSTNGAARVEVRLVNVHVSQPTIRYFFGADREAGRFLKDAVPGSRLQDFTTYEHLPRQGTIEVWLR